MQSSSILIGAEDGSFRKNVGYKHSFITPVSIITEIGAVPQYFEWPSNSPTENEDNSQLIASEERNWRFRYIKSTWYHK